MGYNKASREICSFSPLGMFPNWGCFPFNFPGQQMQWNQRRTLDAGGQVAVREHHRLSPPPWVFCSPAKDLATLKCRVVWNCCKAQTSFFWRRPPALLSQELLMAPPRHLARFCLPSFWREGHRCPWSVGFRPHPGSLHFQCVSSPSPRFRRPDPP